MTSARTIANKLWQHKPNKIIELPQELEKILKKTGSELEVLDSAEKILPQVRRLIRKKIQRYDEKGITPNFRFSKYSENRLIGSFILEKEETIKSKLIHRNELYKFINSLNWKAFENLCLYIIELYNFQKHDRGKRTQDGGLDFFGFYVPHPVVPYLGFLSNMNLRIFGQAKHRNKTVILEGEMRKFYTHYKDFLNKKGRAYSFVLSNCEWFLKTRGPLVPLFFTNSDFSRGAENYANTNGIITRDGEQIVEDVIRLSKNEPWFTLRNKKLKFNPNQFRSHLKKFGKNKRELD